MNNNITPFIKWVGGKRQLLNVITENLPNNINTYVEPFVGGGAVMFHLLNNYPNINKIIINDINTELINTYVTIRDSVEQLINILHNIQIEYNSKSPEEQSIMYYDLRNKYNQDDSQSINKAALFIFLNKTCFNGLYRVNKKNCFNTPFGKYKSIKIYNPDNLKNISNLIKNVEILNQDYYSLLPVINNNCFVYLDPPYKPISKTSSFNSYYNINFNDDEQIKLKTFCDNISKKNALFMLSNSDPKSLNPNDNFFDELYKDYKIKRVKANRNINANPNKRGKINELLITNY